jgi:hypothetical protein
MIILTHHAVEQYVTRHRPGLFFDEAWEDLMLQLPHADRLKMPSAHGDTMWRLPSDVVIITKPARTGGNHVAVTVLKRPYAALGLQPGSPTEEELAALLGDSPPAGIRRAEFFVSVPFTLSKDNEDTVIARIENAIRGAAKALMVHGVAGATVQEPTVERKDTQDDLD